MGGISALKLLVDTCALLWIWFDESKLSELSKQAIRREGRFYVSTISLIEIAIKDRKKALLPIPFQTFVDRITSDSAIQRLELPLETASLLRDLPDFHHDPFDRLLVCLAQAENMTLVTPEPFAQMSSSP